VKINPNNFKPFSVKGENGWAVDWTWEGEGLAGDYDPSDPDDHPLLRASLFHRPAPNAIPDCDLSYCTKARIDCTPAEFKILKRHLTNSALSLISLYKDAKDVENGVSSRLMERWTWRDYPLESAAERVCRKSRGGDQ